MVLARLLLLWQQLCRQCLAVLGQGQKRMHGSGQLLRVAEPAWQTPGSHHQQPRPNPAVFGPSRVSPLPSHFDPVLASYSVRVWRAFYVMQDYNSTEKSQHRERK